MNIHLSNGFSMRNRRQFCPCICLILSAAAHRVFCMTVGSNRSARALRVLSNVQMSGLGDEAEILGSTKALPVLTRSGHRDAFAERNVMEYRQRRCTRVNGRGRATRAWIDRTNDGLSGCPPTAS